MTRRPGFYTSSYIYNESLDLMTSCKPISIALGEEMLRELKAIASAKGIPFEVLMTIINSILTQDEFLTLQQQN